MTATTEEPWRDVAAFRRRMGPELIPGVLVAAAVAVAFLLLGADGSGALVVGAACGLSLIGVFRPVPVYLALVFACMVASVSAGALPIWTNEGGFHIFSNVWKLLSPPGARHFDFLLVNNFEIVTFGLAAGVAIRMARRRQTLAGARDLWLAALFAAGVLLMLVYGLATGGATKPALWQVRPFLHVAILAALTPQLLRTGAQLRAAVWAVLLGIGFKALQTLYIFVVYRGAQFGEWRTIVSHEASIFFVGAIAFGAALLLYGAGGRQRSFMFGALPVLLLALVLNLRRTGYVALAASLGSIPVLLHGRRRLALMLAVPLVVLLGIYAAVFWNRDDHYLGHPIAKVKSVVMAQTASHDSYSNLYRLGESYNLRRTIAENPLGLGFGHAFRKEMELPALDPSFTYWDYHPHNQILGLWMSLGPLGFGFFLLFASGVMMLAAHEIRHQTDPYRKALSFFVVASVASALLATALDMFLWTERGAIFTAVCVGLLFALRAIPEDEGEAEVAA